MSGQDDDSEKSFEPTPRKLEEARRKGEIAKSADFSVAAGYAGMFFTLSVLGVAAVAHTGEALTVLLDQAHNIAPLVFEGHPATVFGGILKNLLWSLSPLFVLPATAVLLSLFAQRAILFTPSKLAMKPNRISLVQNARNKFGRGGLFEFAKGFAKLLIYSICLGFFLRANLDKMASTVLADPAMAAAMLAELLISLLLVVTLVASVLGVIDYLWQRQEHIRKNMMTRKEMMDESKEAEGDPYIKQSRRQKAQAIASNQMLADVPSADVVIVNPTHYAVALKWSRKPGEAPICVAKGTDEIARRIRDAAQAAAVPIRSDPPTARALFATVDIGQEIPGELYRPVATAIRFAEAMRMKMRSQL
ncbi:EscU/YscU/HrcU family type III secretion system export apparatus switch protein [Shimia aestuarii]|uniref:Flagellar biosynthetic protein FlhB n=1 Tax=Shimia aestuarii TaxID=254406 RepID=A0A1I4K9K4_9RHOB|nr:flagellar type III secretion system protein FlhB [Shimia aestuarii]SFL75424.1 flagellar biosynthetic protein FlhB [Shimia aestuarii]